MDRNEEREYQGLAVAIGRITMALKDTEQMLAAVSAERDALQQRVAELEGTE